MSNQLRLLFFIVVISGALCTVEDYVIMSQCAHNKAINLAAEGTVSVTDISKTQNITIVGLPDYINNDFKITLYAKETQRYLCFNENWKLVGMRELQETCYFNETIVHGYFVFRSVVDLQRRVGFTHRGKAIGPKKNVTDACYLFTKIHAEQFFHQHTQFYTPKTKTSSSSSFSPSSTKATTAAASSTPAVTSTATASKSKASRHRSNNNHNNNSNGMRNSNNSNQNQQHSPSHTSNISNSNSNSNTSLSSNTSQHLNVSNTREQRQQQHHQVRHHHNDPNVVARRHQHEHKQKQKQRRQRNRTRATTSPNPTIMTRSKTTTTAAAMTMNSNTSTTTTQQLNKHATSATQTASSNKAATTSATTSQATAANMLTAKMRTTAATITTTVANKRKGRRRKGEKVHKQPQQRMLHQHLPANAKDPQHREAHKASHATRLAHRHQGATTRQADVDDVSAAAAAQGIASSSADYSSQSTEWSSPAPSSSSTASEALQDYDDSSAASSSTFLLSSSSSSWTPQQSSSSSNGDSDAYSVSIATNLVSSMVPTTADASVSATNTNAEVAATSTIDRDTSSSTATQTAENELSSDSSSIASSKPTTTTTTYNISNTWAAATLYADLATTPTEAELLLTPSAADVSNTTTTTEAETARSSSSRDSFEATEEFLDTEATAETATTDAGGSNVAKESDSTGFSNSPTISDDEKNIIDTNKTTGQRTVSPTATYRDAAPTLATLIGANKLRTTQTAATKLLAKQQPPKTTHLRRVGATRASMSSGSGSTSNNLDDSMTDYVLSTKSTHNTHNKNHRHRQPNSNNSKALRNRNQQSNKSKNAFNSKQHHNKLHSKVGSPVTAIKAAATYVPATVATSFISSNPLDPMFGGSTRQQHVINEYDSLKNVHKNINHNQHNNTLLDYTSSSSGSGNYSPQVPEFLATPTTATRKALRKSTQKLLATPFHQLTYVRNDAGDIDIDNIDNISVYSDLMDVDVPDSNNNNGSDSALSSSNAASGSNGNSRMTIVSGYLPTSATATLPESIRIAKIKINKVRKRTLRQRYTGGHA